MGLKDLDLIYAEVLVVGRGCYREMYVKGGERGGGRVGKVGFFIRLFYFIFIYLVLSCRGFLVIIMMMMME